MNRTSYRFENYVLSDFPVYASSPANRKILTEAHFHKEAEIIKITKGCAKVSGGTESYLLKEGDIIFCAPYSIHKVISEEEGTALRGFIFDPALLSDSADFSCTAKTHFLFLSSHPAHDEVNRIFSALVQVYETMPAAFRLRIRALLMLFTSILLENNFLLSADIGNEKIRTAPTIRYIRENYMHPLSVHELASLLNVCDDSFIRIFKAEHNQTPFSYILHFRITEAMKLLSENKYSISEIAARTGFSDAGYFSRIFKEKLGKTPLQYKKENFSL